MKQFEIKRTLLVVVKKVVEKKMNNDVYGWPPVCSGIFYQPVRPKRKTEVINERQQEDF